MDGVLIVVAVIAVATLDIKDGKRLKKKMRSNL